MSEMKKVDMYGEPVDKNDEWITVENGEAVPVAQGQTKAEAIKAHFNKAEKPEEPINKKMTPAEKIASVHIDRSKDNILPELNEEDLAKIGAKVNKPVLIKLNIIERNALVHSDVTEEEGNRIIGEALYNSDAVFRGKNVKPYFSFVKSMRFSPNGKDTSDFGVVLLDVSEANDCFEVVHWHWVSLENLRSIPKKSK